MATTEITPTHWLTPELARDWIKAAWDNARLDPPQAAGGTPDSGPFEHVSLQVGYCDNIGYVFGLGLRLDEKYIALPVETPEELIAAIQFAEVDPARASNLPPRTRS
jgi:hypothetical protein